MKRLGKIWIWLFPAGVLFFLSCAQQGAPTGGAEDVDPPVVVKTIPANYSVNFESEKIMIVFDEFLDMGNFTQELIVSPPMEEKPIVKLRNKTLIIEFEEELKKDVTYTFNFGEGIKDLNEKNVLLNYEYVFSTGDFLDSLSIKGTLKKAFDLTVPESPIYIMLYDQLNDSLPLTDIPLYVGRTDKEGNFAVNNLRAGIYKVFVLKDGNNNFLFDLPTEQIAFLDSSLVVDANYFRNILLENGIYDSSDLKPDTLSFLIDTVGLAPDSIALVLDSLEKKKPDFNSIFVDLFMFTEDPINQYISEYSRDNRHALEMVFNLALTDSFNYTPVFPSDIQYEDLIAEFGVNRDSLTLWLRDTVVASRDTIKIAMNYTVLDTLGQAVMTSDTLQFVYRESTSKKKTAKDKTPEKKKSLAIATIKNKGKQHIYKDLLFTLDNPVKNINPEKFELYIIPDSIEFSVAVIPFIDQNHLRRVRIGKNWKEEASYRLLLYPGAITDIYESTNDTLDVKFQIKPLSDYGKIILTLENVEDTLLIQIMKKDKMLIQKEVFTSGSFVFDFIDPDTYRIKFVHDSNRNGKWDTGKYLSGKQPERVEFLFKDIKIRSNWDHEITYVIGTNTSVPGEEKKAEEEPALFK